MQYDESDYKLQKKKVKEKEIFFEKSLQSLVASPSSPECNMSYIYSDSKKNSPSTFSFVIYNQIHCIALYTLIVSNIDV